MSGWKPIATAPKGLVDIWLSDGRRLCDCYYDNICDEWRTSRPSGRLVSVKAKYVTHWYDFGDGKTMPDAPEVG